MLIGQCLALAQLERLDARLPKRGKIRMSDLVKSYLGLLMLGKSDVEALEAFRRERFFQEALGMGSGSRERVATAAVVGRNKPRRSVAEARCFRQER